MKVVAGYCDVEGTLVKALFHCKLENLKKLIETLLFVEHTKITGQGFHISSGCQVGH